MYIKQLSPENSIHEAVSGKVVDLNFVNIRFDDYNSVVSVS
jgi:hypothetical protein